MSRPTQRVPPKLAIPAGIAGLGLAWAIDRYSITVTRMHIAIAAAAVIVLVCIWEVRRYKRLEADLRASGAIVQGTTLRAAALRETLRHSFIAIGLDISGIPPVFDDGAYVKPADGTEGTHVVIGDKSIAVHRYSSDPRERDLRTYRTTGEFLRAFIGERIVWVCTVDPVSSKAQISALRSGCVDEFLAERKRVESALWQRFESNRCGFRSRLLAAFLP